MPRLLATLKRWPQPSAPSTGGMAMTDTTLVTCSCYWYDGQYCEECADDFFSLPCLCDPESNYVCPPCYEAVVAVLIGGRDYRATRRRPTTDAPGAVRTKQRATAREG